MQSRNDNFGNFRGDHQPYHGGRRFSSNEQHPGFHQKPQEELRRHPGDIVISAKKTFFRHPEDYRTATSLLLVILSKAQILGKEPDEDGLYRIQDVVSAIQSENTDLDYVTRDHIIEIYLKDSMRMIVLDVEHDLVGHAGGGMAIPPDLLYYGTTANVAEKIRARGLQSTNKPFLPLSAFEDDAKKKCSWYVHNQGAELAIVVVDAKMAYEDNVKFSYSGRQGEYLVDRISPRYIINIINYGKPTGDNFQPEEG